MMTCCTFSAALEDGSYFGAGANNSRRTSLRNLKFLFLSFTAAALLLAAIGIYGLMSYSVSQRTYEISVRMAIGAPTTSVVSMILAQSLRIASSIL
jgi:ABC-type antimicrobial peptide transport system permease subunit